MITIYILGKISDKARDMSQFLEFNSTRETRAGQFARGNPTHDGTAPRRFRSLDGIRIDGNELELRDDSLMETIHRTLVEGRRAERKGMAIDAISFIALYNTPEFKGRLGRHETSNSFELVDDPSSVITLAPLRLGHGPDTRPVFRHSVQPINTASKEQLYIHKIGVAGPLCISSLAAALGIYYCDRTKPYSSVSLAQHSRRFDIQ